MLSAPVLVIPEFAPQTESTSPAEEGLAEDMPLDTLESTPHNVSTTPNSDPPPTNSERLPSTVPTVQGKRPREGDGDGGPQNKTRKRRKKSGRQSK